MDLHFVYWGSITTIKRHKNHVGKILAIGIIVLFIGVGIHPVFAVEDKESNKSSTVDFDNENTINISWVTYQNANCFIYGRATYAFARFGLFVIGEEICFGESWQGLGSFPSFGVIYTHGKSIKWKYEGGFYGKLGEIETIEDDHRVIHYIGVKGFSGFKLGGNIIMPSACIFIGHADSVKISPQPPDIREYDIMISNPRTRTSYWLRFFDMFPILQRMLNMIK